jgi:hypothetical protein
MQRLNTALHAPTNDEAITTMSPVLSLTGRHGEPILRCVRAGTIGAHGVRVWVEDRLNDGEGDEVRTDVRLELIVRADACTRVLADALLLVAGALPAA